MQRYEEWKNLKEEEFEQKWGFKKDLKLKIFILLLKCGLLKSFITPN